ncbi:MAG: DUF2283 domain-containing protein [Litorimonas sp.]
MFGGTKKPKLTGDGEALYLYLPTHKRGSGSVAKTKTLPDEFIGTDEPMVNLDYDEAGRLIGIEVVNFD